MNRSRTVLMTCDAVGGVWTYALHLATVFAALGSAARVILAVLGSPPNASQRNEARRIPGLELRNFEGRLEWMDEPWDDVQRSGEWLLELEREVRPDVVHLNMYAHGSLPFRAPALVVAHSCVLSWWSAVKREMAPSKYARYRDEVAKGLASVRAVIAPTCAMLECIRNHYAGSAPGRVIHNGAPAWPLPAAKSHIVFSLGRLWDEAKNLAALSNVAPRIPWPIHVAGSPTHPNGTTRELPGVRSFGWLGRHALASCLSHAAIYAHPARYEPFGLAPLEAAHAGCALVLGDIPSLRELWGDDALYVPPDEHDALADALLTLITDDALRSTMAERARVRAQQFSLEKQGHAYLALYDELTSHPPNHADH